jgi:flagellar basal-body rod protein FlgC
MDFSTSFKIIATGLSAQRAKMDVVVSNMSNVNTTRTPEGGPYKRKIVVFGSEPVKEKFRNRLKDALNSVEVKEIVVDNTGIRQVFDPSHPDADSLGFLSLPNVNVVSEMADMIIANRAYEACVSAFDASKNMALKTLDIGK